MSDDWVRALGIDYGTVRIGLAVSDDLGMLAHPFRTISGRPEGKPIEAIATIVAERKIRDIIVGSPRHADGRESTMSKEADRFAEKLRDRFGEQITVHLVDELMTTKIARDKLLQSGRKKESIGDVIDQAAAVEILQSWLDGRQGPAQIPGEIDLFPDNE